MTWADIVDIVCAKIGKTDTYAQARALESCAIRNKFIYDSFDWASAQVISTVTIAETTFDVNSVEKIISARLNGNFIDPVTPSFIFESYPDLIDTTGTPLYYWAHYNTTDSKLAVTLYPGIDPDGPMVGQDLDLLCKASYDATPQVSTIPNTENALIAFVLADMWEFLRQITKYQAKVEEANKLLAEVQAKDSPGTPKVRTSKNFTSNGSTLVEMTDSVCDIIGRWEPDIRTSIKDRIQRNYQTLYDSYLWPASTVIANADIAADQTQVVLPHFFDKIIAVRANEGGPLLNATPLTNAELPYFFGVDYSIFERSGEPINYSLLPSVATSAPLPISEKINVSFTYRDLDDLDRFDVFIKGDDSGGIEKFETFQVWADNTLSSEVYKGFVTTLTKPITNGSITFKGESTDTIILKLAAHERERKHLRILLLPNESGDTLSPTETEDDTGSVLICGKRKISPLIGDNDSPEIPNVQNVLIAAAAADMLDRIGNGEMAVKYQQKAGALTQILIDAEIKQNTVQPRIVPYAEASCDYGIYGGW